MKKVSVGIIREEKSPQDRRVPLTPSQCRQLVEQYEGLSLVVQPSSHRCYSDQEYEEAGIQLTENLSACDILLGVKEVPLAKLLAGKTYFFFSHTIKKQAYNRDLLLSILEKNIRLVDWETLTDAKGFRVIAFGRWAGIVGAHNGLWTWGERSGSFRLMRARDCRDYHALKASYQGLEIPPLKIAVSGGGRVAQGAVETLENMGIKKVEPEDFLHKSFDEAVYVQLDVDALYARQSDDGFNMQEFFMHPDIYYGRFEPYSHQADLFINAIYWDPRAPVFFTKEQMKDPAFRIRVIADISCDIHGSVPSTIKASTIENPVYGYDPQTERETTPFKKDTIDMMTIDNLPNELPRDASQAFGEQLLTYVWRELMDLQNSEMIHRATIAKEGKLNTPYTYLQDFVDGK